MELKTCTEKICVNEMIYNGTLEQPVELDYMLPDYCPNIFKVLKCRICTKIISKNMMGSSLTIDGVALIKILYISEDTGRICQLEQKQAFTKTVDLKEDADGATACVRTKCDYVNCRAVNQRRLDIRGAVSMKVTVHKPKERCLLCDCEGLQLHKREETFCQRRMTATKDFTVREELQIGHGSQPIQDILNYEATALITEHKILANKVICKGEVLLHTLYVSSQTPEKPEVVEHSVPVSQIIDFEGIDEDFTCCNTLEVVKYDIDMQMEENGECRSFVAQLTLRATCEAAQNRSVSLIDDCYSTAYEVQATTEKIRTERLIRMVKESTVVKNNIRINQSELGTIHDVLYEVTSPGFRIENRQLYATCNLQLSILAVSEENIPVCIDQSMPCEMLCDGMMETEDVQFDPVIQASSLSFNIVSLEEMEIRAELKVSGNLYQLDTSNVMTQVDLQEDQPKRREDDCALRLYFADEGENIWEIAKKYNTSVGAILEQNAVEQETVSARSMIFIPIVD